MHRRFHIPSALAAILLLSACGKSEPAAKPAPKNPAKVLQFYASEGVVRPGDSVTVCYGVEFADTVRIEPFIESITPSHNRCIEAKPARTTVYTLTAEGPDGMDQASFTITTDPNARPAVEAAASPVTLIQFLMASATTTAAGRPVTICYGVKDAVSVSIAPKLRDLEPSERLCFGATFDTTTTLTLTAKNAHGAVDTEKLTITVR